MENLKLDFGRTGLSCKHMRKQRDDHDSGRDITEKQIGMTSVSSDSSDESHNFSDEDEAEANSDEDRLKVFNTETTEKCSSNTTPTNRH